MTRMIRWSLALGLAAGLASTGLMAQQPQKMSGGDARFLQDVAADGQAEVQLADLAASKAASADVKAFAAKLKADHSKANERLKTIASAKLVSLPTSLPSSQRNTEARLNKLEGAAFDKAYLDEMVRDHQRAINTFTGKTRSSDPEVKAFAEDTLPSLQSHLAQAQELRRQIGK